MASDSNFDDLFRQQLGQHTTPPGEDLQRRLAELAEAERLDQLFRTGLGSHASQPRRALWERLEDEHLRPPARRRRGVVAWWQLSAAAMLLLALLSGGLWRGGYLGPRPGLATTQPVSRPATGMARTSARGPAQPLVSGQDQFPTKEPLANALASHSKKNRENRTTQATTAPLSPSSPPIATTARPRRSALPPSVARHAHPQPRQPDAATGALATTGRRATAGQPQLPTPNGASEVPASRSLATSTLTAMVAPAEIIEVDVRRGPAPTALAAPVVAAAAPSPPTDQPRRRLRLGGLLRQADHLVHGESVSLAEATGLPESLTVQARLGGRLVSKTIQL